MKPDRVIAIAERDLESASRRVEKETGVKRTKRKAPCSGCGHKCPVVLSSVSVAEGGFIAYEPSRIEEYSVCFRCSEVFKAHHVVHREGGRILGPRHATRQIDS